MSTACKPARLAQLIVPIRRAPARTTRLTIAGLELRRRERDRARGTILQGSRHRVGLEPRLVGQTREDS